MPTPAPNASVPPPRVHHGSSPKFHATRDTLVGDQPSLWESVLPVELQRLPGELSRVDALLDDPVFFIPFVQFFDPQMGRPSTPMETYLRLMFLKFRYRLGYESLCREVADSISWRRFCRIALDGSVPHPTTLMKLTTRCGAAAVDGLNEVLLAKAVEAKLVRTNKVRADTTVVEADVGYPTDSGLLAKAIGSMARGVARIKAAGGASRTRARDRRRSAARRAHAIGSKLRLRGAQQRDQAQAAVARITGELAGIAEQALGEAAAVVRNAKTALRAASGQRKAQLASGDQSPDVGDGAHGTGSGADPQPSGRGDARVGYSAGQPARCRCPPDPQRTLRQAGGVRLQGSDRR